MPEYCGQPGTVVLGGALPPPQSSMSQSSPVPGTIQAYEAPAGDEMSVRVQPSRSVRASAKVAKAAVAKIELVEVRILITVLGRVLESMLMVVSLCRYGFG